MSVSSIGGYGGIQQWNSANPRTDHGGLYSIWDTSPKSLDAFVIGFNPFIEFRNYTFRFGGEGAGAQLLFKWGWEVGKPYRMSWRRYIEPDSPFVQYEGFYLDPYDARGAGWVWVGTIRTPVVSDVARNMQNFEGFAEAYGGNLQMVREIDLRNVWVLDLTNHWLNISSASMSDSRDPATLTAIPGGWRHRCFDPDLRFKPENRLNMLPTSGLADRSLLGIRW